MAANNTTLRTKNFRLMEDIDIAGLSGMLFS